MAVRALALSMALAATGCSVAFVRGAPAAEPRFSTSPPCTDDYLMPIIDAALAATALTGGVYFAVSDHDRKELAMVGSGVFALGVGLSGLLGYRKVVRCRSKYFGYSGLPAPRPGIFAEARAGVAQ
jgi:hypothetical protein